MSNDCSICLNEIVAKSTGFVQMSCTHTFHLKCISKWLSTNNTCPMCRHVTNEMETLSTSIPATRLTTSSLSEMINAHLIDTGRIPSPRQLATFREIEQRVRENIGDAEYDRIRALR